MKAITHREGAVTTAIPYVNGKPHVGHALELLEADVLARQRGDEVRFQTGTDDNALKNVQGAEAEDISPAEYVERVAQGFLFYRKSYAGLYCVGCELFYRPEELVDGRCPEHGTVPEMVEENNG